MDKTNFITVENLENGLLKKTYSIPKKIVDGTYFGLSIESKFLYFYLSTNSKTADNDVNYIELDINSFAYNLVISKQNIVDCLEELESFDIIECFEDFIYLNNIN